MSAHIEKSGFEVKSKQLTKTTYRCCFTLPPPSPPWDTGEEGGGENERGDALGAGDGGGGLARETDCAGGDTCTGAGGGAPLPPTRPRRLFTHISAPPPPSL